MISFLKEVSEKICEAQADDSQIDSIEIVKIAFSTAPDGVRAFAGAADIDDEWKASTDEEKAETLKAVLGIVQSLVNTFGPQK